MRCFTSGLRNWYIVSGSTKEGGVGGEDSMEYGMCGLYVYRDIKGLLWSTKSGR